MVDIIKHIETGRKYIIGHGDPLPSNAYIRLIENITKDEAKKYTSPQNKNKKKC